MEAAEQLIPQISMSPQRTREEQLQGMIDACAEKPEPLRLRLPLMAYDPSSNNRNYIAIKETAFNLIIDNPTVEVVDAITEALRACVTAIATIGPAEVKIRLAAAPN